jgi:hypothetical protein
MGMAKPQDSLRAVCACVLLAVLNGTGSARAIDLQEEIKWLREQNELLQKSMKEQQSVINALTKKVDRLEGPGAGEDIEGSKKETGFGLNKVMISGEGGVGFFKTGSEGMFPKGDFRVDEAKLFVETPIFENVYFYTEINLMQREFSDVNVKLGECYLDFENLSRWWNREGMLNLRLGRLDIPFGEEYIYRDAIDNPLISHSLSDFWGVDEGVELYGRSGKVSYVVAVQNGGANQAHDFTEDKSLAGRVSYDPTKWLHLSLSGMRTGDLSPHDYWSELYFANGWFVPIGSANMTRYHANLVEGDIELKFRHGRVHAFGGYARYDDNDPGLNNKRDIYFYSVEALHDLTRKLYAGARFSEILAPKGYPLVGNGDMGSYLFGTPSTELWRLSLGLGYRCSENLLLKAEYSFERGKEITGEKRNHEDFVGVEAAFKF